MRNLFKSFNLQFPTAYYTDMDVRTIIQLTGHERVKELTGKFTGTKHDAIADCLYQVKLVSNSYSLLKGELK